MTEILLTAVIVLLCIVVVLQVVFLWLRFYGRRARAKGESVGGLAPGASAKAPGAAATSDGDEKNTGAKSGVLKGTVSAITRRFRPEPEPPEPEPPVVLEAGTNGDRSAEHPHLVAARQLPGYNPARWLLADALLRRSTLLTLDSRPDALAVRYQVDGVWHNGASVGPDVGRPALDALRMVCGIPANGPPTQRGQFAAHYKRVRYEATMASQQVPSGERVVMQFTGPPQRLQTLDDLGMRPGHRETLDTILRDGHGLLLLSATPGAGLRTTTDAVVRGIDRLQRDVIWLEEETARPPNVEAVELRFYNSSYGEGPNEMLPRIFRREPDVVVARELVDGTMVELLCAEMARNPRLVISTVRARDCAEALLRVLALKANRAAFARQVTAVLNQRLIRRLCPACKEPYAPSSRELAALGPAAGSPSQLFRPPAPADEVCPECGGIGYRGRSGLFELLTIDDPLRRVLVAKPQIDRIRKAAAEAGHPNLRQEAARMVAAGETSVAEWHRLTRAQSSPEPASATT